MYDELENALTRGTVDEIDREAATYGLVRAISPDACDLCRAGIDPGHDHRECMTLAPPRSAASY